MSEDKELSEAFKYIESVAQESPNRHAFYRGMVFGLAHGIEFMKNFSRADAIAMTETLLQEIDDNHFKENET